MPKTALVHYWLVRRRGGEAVLEAIGRLFPDADLIANVIDPDSLFGSLEDMPRRKTFVNGLPAARKIYPAYMPLMPAALEALDMSAYDLIISSEAGPAKWVIPSPDAKHICYCHSPMRYIWDQRHGYFRKLPAPLRPVAHWAAGRLRATDVLSSFRVTQFVANSQFVARRIQQYYRRDVEVIHPPVDVETFQAGEPEDFYLCAGQVVSYKRVDLAVQACTALGRRLVIAGGGNLEALKKMAGPTVTFLGEVDTPTLRSLMQRCRALLYPGLEDFGIVPVEVMASGRPVIAFGKGGALDSVVHGETGLLVDEQSADAFKSAILAFEAEEAAFSAAACQANAARFSRAAFERKFQDLTARVMK
jgi:glycosyltransferase involved in cell wall biosynthesis